MRVAATHPDQLALPDFDLLDLDTRRESIITRRRRQRAINRARALRATQGSRPCRCEPGPWLEGRRWCIRCGHPYHPHHPEEA